MFKTKATLPFLLSLGCLMLAPLALGQTTTTTTTTVTEAPAAAPAFAHTLGSVPVASGGATCSVQATAPRGSAEKSQRMKFIVDYKAAPQGAANFRYYMISTGKSKSLAQVQAMFADAFARAGGAAAGAELCKLGDVTLGGEVRLVARGGGETELVYNPPLSSGNPVFTAAESAAFAQALR